MSEDDFSCNYICFVLSFEKENTRCKFRKYRFKGAFICYFRLSYYVRNLDHDNSDLPPYITLSIISVCLKYYLISTQMQCNHQLTFTFYTLYKLIPLVSNHVLWLMVQQITRSVKNH